MKSIEERAREWAEEQLQDHLDYATMSDKVKKVWRENYINDYCHIATEQKAIDEKEYTEEMRHLNEEWKANLDIQRAIDIEKACKVFKDFMWIQYGDRIDESMAMYWKESITKAMEE